VRSLVEACVLLIRKGQRTALYLRAFLTLSAHAQRVASKFYYVLVTCQAGSETHLERAKSAQPRVPVCVMVRDGHLRHASWLLLWIWWPPSHVKKGQRRKSDPCLREVETNQFAEEDARAPHVTSRRVLAFGRHVVLRPMKRLLKQLRVVDVNVPFNKRQTTMGEAVPRVNVCPWKSQSR
jgi:hypothetical protein